MGSRKKPNKGLERADEHLENLYSVAKGIQDDSSTEALAIQKSINEAEKNRLNYVKPGVEIRFDLGAILAAVVGGAFGYFGLRRITKFEDENVLTSKAFGWINKPKV
jgi:hypothetical protein